MRRIVAAILMVAGIPFLAFGCAEAGRGNGGGAADVRATAQPAVASRAPATAPVAASVLAPDDVVASVGNRAITMGRLLDPLIKAYGLNVLLNVVQLDLAKQAAKDAGVVVTPEDLRQEQEMTVARMFRDAEKSEYASLLDQFLARQHISRPEFDLAMETNANLRKVAEPQLKDKITEENVQQGFRIQYGEKVLVHHIQCANQQEIAAALQKLKAGESFEKVASQLSRDAVSAPIGGELPPFTRADTRFGQAFKDVAFGLKVGEVSEPVESNGSLHLIKLVQRMEPTVVKYEDVKDSVRRELLDQWTQQVVRQLKAKIGQQVLTSLKIENPELKKQFDEKVAQGKAQVQGRDAVKKEISRREGEASGDVGAPAGLGDAEAGRPPATGPGATPSSPGGAISPSKP